MALALWLLPSGFAAEIDDLIKAAPGREAYPEAGALILLDRRVVTVDKNNSTTLDRYLVVKIFEDRGRDEFGEITQQFNRDGQTVELLEARTHKPDGTIARPEARAISDVSAPEVADAMAYTNAMLNVVSFPALEENAVIEYHVRVKPRKSTKEDGFSGTARFGGLYPALKREFDLVLPAGMQLHWGWSGAADTVAPRVVTEPGTKVFYRWTFENTPQIIEEPGMPDIARLVPVLSYSSYTDWKRVAARLRKEFDKGGAPSPAVKRLSDSLAAGKSRLEALKAIYLFVTQKLRNVWLDYGDAGYETHKADDILKWKYGDCRDKNCLLASLLAVQGFTTRPVAVNRKSRIPADVPSPDAFDWLATEVLVPGDEEPPVMLLDPFAEYRVYGSIPDDIAGVDGLLLDSAITELRKTPGGELNPSDLAVTTAQLTLELNGDLTGKVTTVTGGCYDNQLRENWRDQTLTDRKRSLAMTASSIKTGAQVDSFWFSDLGDLSVQAVGGFRFLAPRYAVTQKGELSMRMPSPAVVGEQLFGITSSARRRNPVETRPARTYIYKCDMKLPPGVKVDILPDSVSVSDEAIASEGGWARTADGVSFSYTVRVKQPEYSLAEFAGLKAAADALSRPQFREVYFLK